MASSTEYNLDNYRNEDAWVHAGRQDYPGSTYVTGSTIPVTVGMAVTNSSTALSLTLGPAKQNALLRICVLNASSSGIHTFSVPSTDYNIHGAGSEVGESFSVLNGGLVDVFCPSTSIYVVGGPVVGSSDITVAAT